MMHSMPAYFLIAGLRMERVVRNWRHWVLALVLMLLLAQTSFAGVGYRDSAQAKSGATVATLITATNGSYGELTACGSVNPSIPAGNVNDLLIAQVMVRNNATTVTMAGWQTLFSNDTGLDYKVYLFWRQATGGDPNTITQSGTCNHLMSFITRFGNVDTTQPLETQPLPAGNWAYANASLVGTGTQNVTVANSMLVLATFDADNGVVTEDPSFTQLYEQSDTSSNDAAISLNTRIVTSTGAYGPFTNMALTLAPDPNHGVLFAVRPAPSVGFPALTITRPAGTTTGDVMVATIAVTTSAVGISAPSGWSVVQDSTQAQGGAEHLVTYVKAVANIGSEPASYTWALFRQPFWRGRRHHFVLRSRYRQPYRRFRRPVAERQYRHHAYRAECHRHRGQHAGDGAFVHQLRHLDSARRHDGKGGGVFGGGCRRKRGIAGNESRTAGCLRGDGYTGRYGLRQRRRGRVACAGAAPVGDHAGRWGQSVQRYHCARCGDHRSRFLHPGYQRRNRQRHRIDRDPHGNQSVTRVRRSAYHRQHRHGDVFFGSCEPCQHHGFFQRRHTDSGHGHRDHLQGAHYSQDARRHAGAAGRHLHGGWDGHRLHQHQCAVGQRRRERHRDDRQSVAGKRHGNQRQRGRRQDDVELDRLPRPAISRLPAARSCTAGRRRAREAKRPPKARRPPWAASTARRPSPAWYLRPYPHR